MLAIPSTKIYIFLIALLSWSGSLESLQSPTSNTFFSNGSNRHVNGDIETPNNISLKIWPNVANDESDYRNQMVL